MDRNSEKEDGHNEASDSEDSIDLSDSSLPSEISFGAVSMNTNTTLDVGNLLEQFGDADISQVAGLNISAIERDTRGDNSEEEEEDGDDDDDCYLLGLSTYLKNTDITQASGPNISAIERAVDRHTEGEDEEEMNVTMNNDNPLCTPEGESFSEAINLYSLVRVINALHIVQCGSIVD